MLTDGLPSFRTRSIGVAAAASPALTFYLSARFSCPAGTQQRTLFTSVADTSQTDEIPAGQPSPATVRLDVPLWQIPWLERPDLACADTRRRPEETGENGTRYFRLRAATSGHVTLTCRDDAGRETAAEATTALDAWLSCPALPPT